MRLKVRVEHVLRAMRGGLATKISLNKFSTGRGSKDRHAAFAAVFPNRSVHPGRAAYNTIPGFSSGQHP